MEEKEEKKDEKEEKKYHLPKIPKDRMRPKENPEVTYIKWETTVEKLTFMRDFIRDRLLLGIEYWSLAFDSPLKPEYDNGWTKIYIVKYIVKDYLDLIVNGKRLPSDLDNIKDLLEFLNDACPARDICRNYGSLKKYINDTFHSLTGFHKQTGLMFEF